MTEMAKIISPVNAAQYAERPYLGEVEAREAVKRASVAQHDWQAMPLVQRVQILERAVELLDEQRDELAEELAWQMGRPVSQGAVK